MKIALTVDIPDNFKIRGYDMPMEGDYVLSASGDPIQVHSDDHAYHCCGIILDKVWEPEEGKYYEFSDLDNFVETEIHKYVGNPRENEKYIYEDETGQSWNYMRPVDGSFGS